MSDRPKIFLLLFSVVVATATVPNTSLADAQALPSQQKNWLNSSPLTLEAIKGKGALLWFFEEG